MTRRLRALVQEIGGPEALYEILLEFYQAMSGDTMIGFFFAGQDLARIARMQQGFILKAAGLSARYEGKNPASAHLSLPPILPGHFDRRLRILEETLRNRGVRTEAIQTWVEFESAFRKVVET